MSGSCRVAFLDVREAPFFVREWSKDPLGCSEVVGRPSQMSGSGERPSRMSGWPRGFLKMVGKPF